MSLIDYVELTRALEKSIEESEQAFENGFYFPQPPSPNFFTEAPTPEFIGASTICPLSVVSLNYLVLVWFKLDISLFIVFHVNSVNSPVTL